MKTKSIALLAALMGVGLGAVSAVLIGRTRSASHDMLATNAAAKQLYSCGMHPQVVQDHVGNCPICHMKLVPMRDGGGGNATAKEERRVLYYWDPMLGPSSIANKPGKSAMGMERVPVYADQQSAGPSVRIDPTIVQNMGVRTAEVTRGRLQMTLRAVGVLTVPEPGLHDITLRINGWIDKLYADTDGMVVKKDQPLFELYSPELQVAENELIMAVQSFNEQAAEPIRKQAQSMVESAKHKLRQWNIAEQDIDAIAKVESAPRTITFRSPADGHIVDKQVVQGSAVQMGMKLMRIEDHSQLWLDSQVFEQQLPWVAMGQEVHATIDGAPGKDFTGKVSFISPHVDHMTRSTTLRTVFRNPNHELRPGMYATAKITADPTSDAILVPREAVIDTGTRQIAFVAMPEGRFQPRKVRMGQRGEELVQILEGLAPGESVVTSGQFLMDVESRTTEAIEKLRGGSKSSGHQMMPTAPIMPPTAKVPMSERPSGATVEMKMPGTAPAAAAPKVLSVAFCPMKKAKWLQSGDNITNPYYGTEMSDCGEVTKHVAAPSEGSVLMKTADAYLAVQKDLSSDKLNPKDNELLRKVTGALEGEKYATLRDAVGKFADAKDLVAARVSFQTVSDALIALLPEAGK